MQLACGTLLNARAAVGVQLIGTKIIENTRSADGAVHEAPDLNRDAAWKRFRHDLDLVDPAQVVSDPCVFEPGALGVWM